MRELLVLHVLVLLEIGPVTGPVEPECIITHCRPGSCYSKNFCKRCKDGHYLDTKTESWRHLCPACPPACFDCDGNEDCSKCDTGRYGYRCKLYCPDECKDNVCAKDSGSCTNGCISGYYQNTDDTCDRCPTGCSKCSSELQCTECVSGKLGTKCEHDCPENCYKCDKHSGLCSWGCMTGYFSRNNNQKCECSSSQCSKKEANVCQGCYDNTWYPESNGCCPCSEKCKDNMCSTDGTCIDCNDGKHGENCDKNCQTRCKKGLCYRNGSCISCHYEYRFGPTCGLSCSSYIRRCSSCYGLSRNSLTCTRCVNGWYPEGNECKSCSYNCKSSTNPTCDSSTGSCKNGCKTGWFGDRCDIDCNVTNCQICSDLDPNICHACKDGFYSERISSCAACPNDCLVGTICDKRNGSCSGGCEENWSGKQCDIPCPSNCRQCDQFSKASCSSCKEDFYGDSCDHTCNAGCATRNGLNTCDKLNATCNYGCKDTFWGNHCENRCGEGCSRDACSRTTGYCLSPCKATHFGKMCDKQCSIYCNTIEGRSCNETDGFCLNGCHVGWFGSQCNEACNKNCKEKICDIKIGYCTSGCIDGYTGPTCMQALLKDDSSNAATIGGIVCAGVAVLAILVVVVVLIVLRRRKTTSKMDSSRRIEEKQSLKYNKPAAQKYSNINEARIAKQNVEISGVTSRLYANNAVPMSEVSGKEKKDIIVINRTQARPTRVDHLKEIEGGEERKVDDGDASGVADDTYYNIAGQRVAVARLAGYIKNKSQEDLFNDFEKIPKGLVKSYNEAKKSKNAAKNKYRAIYPYDENRVILLDGGSDYMNASYIDGYNRQKEYIASSGPFQRNYDTTSDFWRMIFQERCETLVMLTQPMENGQTKCTKYWPDADESCQYGEIQIICLTEDVYADFTIRLLAVTKGMDTIHIRHVHFTAWPDKGIPHDVTSMIELRQKVRSLHKDKETPIIVHCSAGIGRTGTFIALDMLTFEGEDRGSVDIFGSVVSLRNQRCNMVQTPEQYVYLHHSVLHSLTFDCHSIPGDMFLQNYNKMIESNGGERIIDKQFKQLQSVTEEVTDEDRAQIQKNKALPNKNRKDADVPADEGRVKLHENRKPGDSDYINAVYVNSFRRKRRFICAQTPLPSTVVDFLSLVNQERCTCIVSMEEPDINDKTVKVYWPADNQIVEHGVFKVSCKDSKTMAHYVSKKLSITYHGPNGEESRDVNLLIFTNWPKDSLVPKTSDSLLELVKTVEAMNRRSEYEAPILIHCRTGAERSCLYCAVSVLIEKMEIEHEVSVVNTLRQIKARRLSAISSVEQYKFCHQAVISYLQSFDIYSNFGLKEADA